MQPVPDLLTPKRVVPVLHERHVPELRHLLPADHLVHGVERAVLRQLELLHEEPLFDVVDANVLGLAAGQDAGPVGRVTESEEALALKRFLGRDQVRVRPAAPEIVAALDRARLGRGLSVEEGDVSVQRGDGHLQAVRPKRHRCRVAEDLDGLRARADRERVPDSQGLVPAGAREGAARRRRAEPDGGNRALVAAEDLQELTGLHGPEVNLVDVGAAGGDEVAAGVDRQAAELCGSRGGEGSKVAVARHVEGAHGSVERGGDNHFPTRHECDGGDGRRVLVEGDKAA